MLPPASDDLLTTADAAAAFAAEREASGPSIFVRELIGELRTTIDAARRVDHAARSDDALSAYAFLRIVVESTIRLCWLAGDEAEPDAAVLRQRIEARRVRDLERLRSALELVPESPGRREAIALLNLEQAGVRSPAAPWITEQLARTAEARLLYQVHKLCSALIHPGLGIRRISLIEPSDARSLATSALDYAAKVAASSAGVLDRSSP
jgi:hypothetical protein